MFVGLTDCGAQDLLTYDPRSPTMESKDLLTSAQRVHRTLPIHIARRISDMNALPYGVLIHPLMNEARICACLHACMHVVMYTSGQSIVRSSPTSELAVCVSTFSVTLSGVSLLPHVIRQTDQIPIH